MCCEYSSELVVGSRLFSECLTVFFRHILNVKIVFPSIFDIVCFMDAELVRRQGMNPIYAEEGGRF